MDDWIFQVISTLGYLGLAMLLVAENLFPLILSEVVLPLAGFVVGGGDLGFLQALVASTTGSVAGALILYALGRYGGAGISSLERRVDHPLMAGMHCDVPSMRAGVPTS